MDEKPPALEDLIDDTPEFLVPPGLPAEHPSYPWLKRIKDPNSQREDFLRLLHDGCRVRAAAQAIGVSTDTPYRWRRNEPAFREAWDKAVEHRTEQMIKEAHRRALAGSDRLLMWCLANEVPEKYATERNKLEVSGTLDIAQRILAARRRTGKE